MTFCTSGVERLEGIRLAKIVQDCGQRYLSTERDWARLGSVGSFLFIALGRSMMATSVVGEEQIDGYYKLALGSVELLAGPWGVYAGEGPLFGIRTMKDDSGWGQV